MDMTDFNEACKRLTEAWKAFEVSLREAIQVFSEMFGDVVKETIDKLEDFLGCLRKKEESKKPNWIPPIKYHKKDYLHNQNISAYRVDRKIQRNLAYQRRNYQAFFIFERRKTK